MRTTYITALVIAVLLGLWLASGTLGGDDQAPHVTLADQKRADERVSEDAAPTRVRVTVINAAPRDRLVKVRGKTENKRTVEVKVELAGRIIARPVERGTKVATGDLLCELSVEDRQASLTEARAALSQAQIEFQGALSLKEKGYNSDTAIAGAKARLAAAQANINRRELDLKKTRVRAPFAGIVEDVHQEIGAYVVPGASCATVVDMDPMLLVGRVSEQDIVQLSVGQQAIGYLRNGNVVRGPVSFIGQQNDPTTRTYAIEIQLPNPQEILRSGITTEIHIPVESIMAQKVSPALFSLSDNGGIGIRTINTDNIVEFHAVKILADAEDGAWVTGLPNRAAIITVGQELVTAGERVDPIFQGKDTLPAKAPRKDAENKSAKSNPTGAARTATPVNVGGVAY